MHNCTRTRTLTHTHPRTHTRTRAHAHTPAHAHPHPVEQITGQDFVLGTLLAPPSQATPEEWEIIDAEREGSTGGVSNLGQTIEPKYKGQTKKQCGAYREEDGGKGKWATVETQKAKKGGKGKREMRTAWKVDEKTRLKDGDRSVLGVTTFFHPGKPEMIVRDGIKVGTAG